MKSEKRAVQQPPEDDGAGKLKAGLGRKGAGLGTRISGGLPND